MRNRFGTVFVAVVALMLGACGGEESGTAGAQAGAVLRGVDGAEMGEVVLTQGPSGVLISADVRGLSAGGHGFHIHSVGACQPDFGAAGGHFNPEEVGHGLLREEAPHPGDLPNVYAGADGVARADFFTSAVTLGSDGDYSLFDEDGSAIIVHAQPDSYGADPAAGDRVACGVIELR